MPCARPDTCRLLRSLGPAFHSVPAATYKSSQGIVRSDSSTPICPRWTGEARLHGLQPPTAFSDELRILRTSDADGALAYAVADDISPDRGRLRTAIYDWHQLEEEGPAGEPMNSPSTVISEAVPNESEEVRRPAFSRANLVAGRCRCRCPRRSRRWPAFHRSDRGRRRHFFQVVTERCRDPVFAAVCRPIHVFVEVSRSESTSGYMVRDMARFAETDTGVERGGSQPQRAAIGIRLFGSPKPDMMALTRTIADGLLEGHVLSSTPQVEVADRSVGIGPMRHGVCRDPHRTS